MSESLGDDNDDGRNEGMRAATRTREAPSRVFTCTLSLIAAQFVRPGSALEPNLCRTMLVQKKRRGIATAAQGS